jgi:hypothetical protein
MSAQITPASVISMKDTYVTIDPPSSLIEAKEAAVTEYRRSPETSH